MKYLKYFEATEDPDMIRITTDEIKECFYDLEDEGWVIRVESRKKMFHARDVIKTGNNFTASVIPYIEVRITKTFNEPRLGKKLKLYRDPSKEAKDLSESEEFKGCLGCLNSRLEEHNLFIKSNKVDGMIDGSKISILIYRKSDENYIQ